MRRSVCTVIEMLVVGCVSFLVACAQLPDTATPGTWDPDYWDQMMLSLKDAQQRGDVPEIELVCGRALSYVDAHIVNGLFEYADFLDSQQFGSGTFARAKAERLAQVKMEQTRATKPTNWYLGFVPWDELTSFADALHRVHRQSDAGRVRALASAYKFSQEVHARKTVLLNEGKDARGECRSFQ